MRSLVLLLVAFIVDGHPASCIPCFLDTYDSMMVVGTKLEEHGVKNKTIRFALYREMAIKYFGHLGKGIRKKLPTSIE
jgi:hypothetical protein